MTTQTVFNYLTCKRDPRCRFNPIDPLTIERLATSISKYGYLADFPIVVTHDAATSQGCVFDGWHRILACRKMKIEPAFVEFRNLPCPDPAVFHLITHHYRKDILKMSQALSLLCQLELDGHTRTDYETKTRLREVNLSEETILKAMWLKSRVSVRLIEQHLANPKVTTLTVLKNAAR